MTRNLASPRIKQTYVVKDPLGRTIAIPKTNVDDFPYFNLQDPAGVRSFYEAEGYVVVPRLIDADLCERTHAAFASEVKPAKSLIYRQASADPEPNVFTEFGFMLNSILNVHCVDPALFPEFRRLGTEIVTAHQIQSVLRILFDEPGKLVQSMYFEGNPTTWAHQDSYYLDSEHIGSMAGVWVAVEAIKPEAGRFFICPKSHLCDIAKNGGDIDFAFNHARYKAVVKHLIEERGFECHAPALAKGDVVVWNSRTIHGSLETTDGQFSRRSIIGHYIPDSHRLLQFQSRIKPLQIKRINGINVHHPKDLALLTNRAILAVETTLPRTFKLVKRLLIKAVTT